MKLYVNGDSHAAAAEAVNTFAFAEDDGKFFYLGRAPHPENAKVSWARRLADITKCALHLDAESASSNDRIIRTTRDWVNQNHRWLPETLMIIQWSTWERQEWLIDGVYYQINASGIDDVPESHQKAYKEFVVGVNWLECENLWHKRIWNFHKELESLGVRHVFFNGNTSFKNIEGEDRVDWGTSYIQPYSPVNTFDQWLKNNGHLTVSPESYHFGPEAHTAWAQYMLQYVINNKLI